MALLTIVKYPDPVLLKKTREVKEITPRENLLVRDMIDTMYAEKGVGLAANQVGVPLRIFVASADQVKGREIVCVNPRIVKKSGSLREEEGCLSVPGFSKVVRRFKKVTLRAQDLDLKEMRLEAEGLLARIFQHETDHLDGFLYVHRLNFFDKKIMLRKLDRETGSSLRAPHPEGSP